MTFYPFSIRFDPWQTDYGSEVASLDATVDDDDIDLEVEQAGQWSAVVSPPEAEAEVPATMFFVDGVRRVDARIVGRREDDHLFHGAFGSYAVGAVEARPQQRVARIVRARFDRVVATGAGTLLPEAVRVNRALSYRPVSTAKPEPIAPERVIHDEMRAAEERLARELAAHEALVVTDGPLTFQEATRGLAVGWVKRIQELYVPPSHLPVLLELPSGARTPLFVLRSSRRFARYSWFLRLVAPRRGDSELSGLVRCEVAEHVGVARAVVLANATAGLLPRYAGIRGLHARAPQNLLPIAALEARLRRELGDARVLNRYLQGFIAEEAARGEARGGGGTGEGGVVIGEGDRETVGVVLGSQDATPLEFWIGVHTDEIVQLDDLVVVRSPLPDGSVVAYYGIVDQIRKRFEGPSFDTDAFRAAAGTLPVEISCAAHVQVTRIDPEVFAPPSPGDAAAVVRGEQFQRALYFDQMERRVAIGITRTGEPVFANLEFLDGTRGAHASISGISGVATKTSYATFLLYSVFHSGALGLDAANAKALIFNVKGEDLLWLDRPNARLDERARGEYQRLGLPVGAFQSVGLYAPARRATATAIPDTGTRQVGVRPYLWTLGELARQRLLRFAFADAEDALAQVSFVVTRVEAALDSAARQQAADAPHVVLNGTPLHSFAELVAMLDTQALDGLVGGRVAPGTLDAFRRRLHAAAHHIGHLVRDDGAGVSRRIEWRDHQVTVVDIHRLHAVAQMFVVGALVKRAMEEKEATGASRPLLFVVLDELNKYAPRTGWSPLADLLLDVAERGRSLGVSLLGAQQTASEVERRVVANASLRVVGRLDAAEAERGEYGWLTRVARQRAAMLQPGSMIVSQPQIPTPVLLRFPFPCWATRGSEAGATHDADLFARMEEP